MSATVRSLLNAATEALAEAGSPDAAAEAIILVGHALGKSRSWLYAWPESVVDESTRATLDALVARRLAGQPVAHILGHREFWSLTLQVTSATLIPRPETELVVERVLAHLSADRPARVADLGTGSGAIAAALAVERPHWRILATDTDAATLEVAHRNFARLGLTNIECRLGEWLAPLNGETFDLIASNPPYIAAADPHLEAGDLRFEPRHALASGDEGLDALRQIVAAAPDHLESGGWLVLEHGFDQGEAVRALLAAQGFRRVQTHRDLAGHERVTEGCRERPNDVQNASTG